MQATIYPEYKARQDICEIGRRLYHKDLVGGTEGNISLRLTNSEILTTPTGVCKGYMTPDMLVKVKLTGEVISGKHQPSSELKMHLRVYQERQDVRAVVHAHPPHATAFAIAGQALNMAYMPEVVVLLGTVPVAEYGTPSTHEVPDAVSRYVHDHNALLLENHGALAWGNDIFQALYRMETLEFYARISYLTKTLGIERELSQERVQQLLVLREKMGISGNTPQGIACESGENACAPNLSYKTRYSGSKEEQQKMTSQEASTTSARVKAHPPGINPYLYQQLLNNKSIDNSYQKAQTPLTDVRQTSDTDNNPNELEEIIKLVTQAVLKQI